MKGFNFEKNLEHQSQAVINTVAVFEDIEIVKPNSINKNYINPKFEISNITHYGKNLLNIVTTNSIDQKIKAKSRIIDIMMETGTGKTYTYTKTIFELNKIYGIFKFIIVVPTLSIKAGTIDFLKSDSSREHFKEQYNKTINLYIVESIKKNKSKKSFIPPAVNSFVNAGDYEKNSIQVLIINAGMINSETMQKQFDKGLFDKYNVPFDAIAAVNPFMIIDEPHKFAKTNVTWENIQKMKPQFILRYGATFQEYENLIYKLTAVDAFNKNLVKGVIGHITEFKNGENAVVKLINTDGQEAKFELTENNKSITKSLAKRGSLEIIHQAMSDLFIESMNKTTVVLSNGMELKKGDRLNPYSYAQTLQETMIQKAIENHFKIEKELLTRDVKIKPLTLFFIDNIEEYRNSNGYIRKTVEKYIIAQINKLIKTEDNKFYKQYLQNTLNNISKTHGGYFSKDNSDKDEAIESEINEILHDKQAMLDLGNPRRFIFSKWTLREGWDNPNVFQICKLRSSGSEISKLQEVGRGLRLPVNEYGNRVKDEQFYLNYFVDFTESDFVDKLVNEINTNSGAFSYEDIPEKLSEEMIKKICELYNVDEDDLIDELVDKKIIKASHKFLENGFEYIKQNYFRIFEGVNSNKVRKATDNKKQITVRTEKYPDLQKLWEELNEKAILEYKIENEKKFLNLFVDYLKQNKDKFVIEGVRERKAEIEIIDDIAKVKEEDSIYNRNFTPISTMKYSEFIKELSKALNINLKTIHKSFIDSDININSYLNTTTIRIIKQGFDVFLMENAFKKFEIAYKNVSQSIHPTKLTDKNGYIYKHILASDIGVFSSDEEVSNKFLFDELYYDSELEKDNILSNIREVVVFTKIPKNSIKIPIAGGKSYSPDFAYVIDYNDGKKKLNFIIETKNYERINQITEEEQQKIKHAEKFFGGKINIKFTTQFSNEKIVDLINKIVK
ncbi:MAG: type III restriction-modification system endonuclease [Bacteroidales bacterium]|nr:type III restriction-modification system endonuclease [Bacteroidales bacterium]MDD2577035.1 type III restriction-modification system endonuclease [Bacteroidales bacterium]MDY4789838.1 type III restriction-modification system endonuclease [Bacteroidales bacterium]